MTGLPQETLYHRSMGWHAPAMRRAVVVVCIGILVALGLLGTGIVELAVVGGWDAAALTFLLSVWPILRRSNGDLTRRLAVREDQSRGSARALLLVASIASLLGVGAALSRAGSETGALQVTLIGFAALTVMLSWTMVNTVYTLRYADLYYGSTAGGIGFDSDGPPEPSYLDFAYIAFTIGMTYQVSDTSLRDPAIRRSVLSHAILSYLFGVVIVGGSVSLVTGLIN
jgi:uncharacterized membrane protein